MYICMYPYYGSLNSNLISIYIYICLCICIPICIYIDCIEPALRTCPRTKWSREPSPANQPLGIFSSQGICGCFYRAMKGPFKGDLDVDIDIDVAIPIGRPFRRQLWGSFEGVWGLI